MTELLDFTQPNAMSDMVLLIEGNKLYVNRFVLSHHSPVFRKLLLDQVVETKQQEIELNDVNYESFVKMLRILYPPHLEVRDIKTCESLLNLADFYQVEMLFKFCDNYLYRLLTKKLYVNLEKYLLWADKYELSETKKALFALPEIKKMNVLCHLMDKPEYSEMSGDFKAELLENAIREASKVICQFGTSVFECDGAYVRWN